MKKQWNMLLTLLLCTVLFLTACAGDKQPQTPTDEAGNTVSTEESTTAGPTAEQTFSYKGIWYSSDSLLAIDLSGEQAVYYSIKPGYYQYTNIRSGAFTVEGNRLKLNDLNADLIYNPTDDTLGTEDSDSFFVRASEAPAEFVLLPFPNYAEMDCAGMVNPTSYVGFDLHKNAVPSAKIYLFDQYYNQKNATAEKPTVADRPAEYGDYLQIDYTGYLNDEKFAGGEATDTFISILDGNGFIPGFADGLIGHTAADGEFDVPVTFPEDYHSAEMAGKSVIFKMKIKNIYELTLTDEQATELSDGEETTYQTMLDDITNRYLEQFIWEKILEQIGDVNLPMVTYDYFRQQLESTYRNYAYMYNMDYETFLALSGATQDDLIAQAKKSALKFIVSYAIQRKENIPLTEEDYQIELNLFIKDAMEYLELNEADARNFVLENEKEYLHAVYVSDAVTAWLASHDAPVDPPTDTPIPD